VHQDEEVNLGLEAVDRIKHRFNLFGSPAVIPLQEGGETLEARLTEEGVMVNNLGTEPFLPWDVFTCAVTLLDDKGGRASRGDAAGDVLGQTVPLNSIEGCIAAKLYGKKEGEVVLSRAKTVSAILIWAGVCWHEPGELILLLG
jgi:hypothetical protein